MSGTDRTAQSSDALYSKENWVPIYDNNFQLDLKLFKCQDPVILSILQKHYLWFAFNEAKPVPEVYLQQFWGCMRTESKKDWSKIMTKLGDKRVVLTPSTIRETLKLPVHQSYAPLPSNEELIKGMKDLGYDSPLPLLSNFTISNLPHPWKSLFGLVNKCLSPKHAGHDKCNKQILQIFHGIAYDKKYDMAQLFWTELMDQVKVKENNKGSTIPYARWLALMIHNMLEATPTMPKRKEDKHFAAPKLKYFQRDNNKAEALPIPDSLLNLANPKDKAIIDYKESLKRTVPMVQQKSAGPSQGTKPSEGSKKKRAPPQKPVATRPNDDQSANSSERTQTAEGHSNAEDTADEPSSQAPSNKAGGEASDSMAKGNERRDDDDDDDADDDDDMEGVLISNRKRAGKQAIPIDSDSSSDDIEAALTPRPLKGIIISEQRSKKHNEKPASSQPKKRLRKKSAVEEELALYDDCDTFVTIDRTTPLGAGADPVSSRVEVAASGSTAHAQPSPIHSPVSQQTGVSITQGELTPTSLIPSESTERLSGQQPRTTTPIRSITSSLGVTIPTFLNFTRTPTLFTAHTGALTLNATTGVQTMMVGSPATPTMPRSLNAGHTTVTTPVTGTIIPEDILVYLNSFLESTIKPWVHEAITANAQDSGSTPVVQDIPPKPQTTQPPTISIPISKPLAIENQQPSTSRGTQDTELVFSPTTTKPNLTTVPFEDLVAEIYDRILDVEEGNLTPLQKALLHALDTQNTCRDSLRGAKRSHEDPDDSDSHEGENKRQRILEHVASTSQPSKPNQPSTSTNEQPTTSASHKSLATLSSMVELDITSRGTSPIDVNQGRIGSPDDATTSTSSYSGHQLEPSSKLMSTGNPEDPGVSLSQPREDWPHVTKYRGLVSAQEHRVEIIEDPCKSHQDPDATPDISPQQQQNPSSQHDDQTPDELEEILVYDKWPRQWTEWDDLRVEAEQYEMCRSWHLREFLNKYHAQMIGLDNDEIKEGEKYKEPKSVTKQKTTPKPLDSVRIKTPFLEEIKERIWRTPEKIKTYRELRMRGINHLKGRDRGGNLYMLGHRSTGERRQTLNHNLATSGCPVQTILKVTEEYLEKIKFMVFHLQRTDGSTFTCQENDFFLLHMDDVYQMFMRCRELPVHKDRLAKEGFEAIKRFMMRQIRYHGGHDLQMGLEMNYPKVNLTKPDLDRPGIEDFPEDHIFDNPVSVIYLNHEGKKRLLFASEINKYCDGTLKIIRNRLQSKREELVKKSTEATKDELRELERTEDVLKAIKTQLENRNSLRSYEHALNLRKNYYKAQK
ncbi:unnamed protein product [Cuscuta epithymum]|uniref:Uncharacterized protein n=1 Tax=Cuscuta epithymum TaxID=186058 RepID=A0AAV0DAE9_9ASTE|nr:unnamed protein product [Cuscuta epithymum]